MSEMSVRTKITGKSHLRQHAPGFASICHNRSRDDHLAFAPALLGERPELLRPETQALMVTNQLTTGQHATAPMFGSSIFAAGHGYGMGSAVVLELEHADPLRCRGASAPAAGRVPRRL
jgi:hypothetical protein